MNLMEKENRVNSKRENRVSKTEGVSVHIKCGLIDSLMFCYRNWNVKLIYQMSYSNANVSWMLI